MRTTESEEYTSRADSHGHKNSGDLCCLPATFDGPALSDYKINSPTGVEPMTS